MGTASSNKEVLADEDSLRLIPDDWWAFTGTIRGGDSYTAKRYEREFSQWLRNVRQKFVKTEAELLWFYRIENAKDAGMERDEWHLHFVFSGRHIEKQIADYGDREKLAKHLESLWPGGANKDIHSYQASRMGGNEWGKYISKVTPHDKVETFTKFSPGLVKEVRRRRRKTNA